jgi:hypothetical protein
MTRPLMVRVLMSRGWNDAFRLVWAESFKAAAADMGIPASQVDIVVGNLPSWGKKRASCPHLGQRCADYDLPELACCWMALAIDPGWSADTVKIKRAIAFMPVLFALAHAITEDPSLLDDKQFGGIVQAWKFMCELGIRGHDDPILAARTAAPMLDVDRGAIVEWAVRLHGSDV